MKKGREKCREYAFDKNQRIKALEIWGTQTIKEVVPWGTKSVFLGWVGGGWVSGS